MKAEEFTCAVTPEDLLLFEPSGVRPEVRLFLSVWQDSETAMVILDKPTALRLANKILELFNE